MIKVSFSRDHILYTETDRAWYNTKRGIQMALVSLRGLKELLRERHEDGYVRNERFNEFYILGRYHLDSCGNCARIVKSFEDSIIPKEEFPDIPDVLTHDEFFGFLTKKGASLRGTYTTLTGHEVPESDLVCPHCGEGWAIENCHDSVVRRTTKTVSLEDFVGLSLGEVKYFFGLRTDAIWFMQPDILIRNDRFINLTLKYPDAEEDWKKSEVVNKHGWVSEKDEVDESYIIQEGDEGHFNVLHFYHENCSKEDLAVKQEEAFRKVFAAAGFETIKIRAIPNEYCSCERCAPWFDVETEIGVIRIGWRKRVINISFANQVESGSLSNASDLFSGEDVTKAKDYIHAWGDKKAQEYLKRVRSAIME